MLILGKRDEKGESTSKKYLHLQNKETREMMSVTMEYFLQS